MNNQKNTILIPGKSILGVMGSGQLGRMFAQKAQEMGYQIKCYSPDRDSPASRVGAMETIGEYSDSKKLRTFLESIDALTFEFENIPSEALDTIEEYCKEKDLILSPSVNSIRISQNRFIEKEFFRSHGLKTTAYYYLSSLDSLEKLKDNLKFPIILKTNRFGYDGKGQGKFQNYRELESYLQGLKSIDHLLEEIVDFSSEISVVACRFSNGKILFYPPSENIHKNHILDFTMHPASVKENIKSQAIEATKRLLESLEYVGVLALEFFIFKDEVICNEFAPRPHNSGHFTMDASTISQFELQLRTLCNLELDQNEITTLPCIMKNLIGNDFADNIDFFTLCLRNSNYRLHLYQKREALPGRKMGHCNFLGDKNNKEAFPFS